MQRYGTDANRLRAPKIRSEAAGAGGGPGEEDQDREVEASDSARARAHLPPRPAGPGCRSREARLGLAVRGSSLGRLTACHRAASGARCRRDRRVGPVSMIARTWRGAVRAEDADAYLDYLEATGLKEYRATPGNRAALA